MNAILMATSKTVESNMAGPHILALVCQLEMKIARDNIT